MDRPNVRYLTELLGVLAVYAVVLMVSLRALDGGWPARCGPRWRSLP